MLKERANFGKKFALLPHRLTAINDPIVCSELLEQRKSDEESASPCRLESVVALHVMTIWALGIQFINFESDF